MSDFFYSICNLQCNHKLEAQHIPSTTLKALCMIPYLTLKAILWVSSCILILYEETKTEEIK